MRLGVEYCVHSTIIGLHSMYFRSLLERDLEEKNERKIILFGDSQHAFHAMMDFFYGFTYHTPEAKDFKGADPAEPRNAVEMHSHVFTLADKYEMLDLKELAFKRFNLEVEAVKGDGTFADRLNLPKAAALVSALPHIFSNAPANDRRLCDAAVNAFKQRRGKLLQYVVRKDFEAALVKVPEFGVSLISSLSDRVMLPNSSDTDRVLL